MNKNLYSTGIFISFLIFGLAIFVHLEHQKFEVGLATVEPLVAKIDTWDISNFSSAAEAQNKLSFIQSVEKMGITLYKKLISVHFAMRNILFFIAFIQLIFVYQLYRSTRK